MAIDAESKLVPCWHIGTRDADAAAYFMEDLASRLAHRVQLTSDGHKAYLSAVEEAFGWNGVDYAMLVKLYSPAIEGERRYSPPEVVAKVGDELLIDGPDAEVNDKMDFRFDVAFGEPGIIEGEPLLETLQGMADLVGHLIADFRPLLS